MSDFTSTAQAASRRELPLSFTASGSEYFRIWIVNLLLTIVTLGLYLPFAKARRLRYFYANTVVDDQALAFHGDPWKMFRGHLLVMGMALIYFFASHTAPMVGVVIALVLMAVWPALWRSSLIFRMRNTSWRGLRFDFTGSLGGAYKVFLPWFGFVILLGVVMALAFPQMDMKRGGEGMAAGIVMFVIVFYLGIFLAMAVTWVWLKRYQHNGYRLANQQASLDMGVGAVLMIGLKALGLTLLAMVALVIGAAVLGAVGMFSGGRSAAAVGAVLAVVGFYAVLLFVWGPYFAARFQDLLWSNTRTQNLVMRSRLSARSLGLLTLKNWVLIVLTLGLYRPFAVVATTRLKLHAIELAVHGDVANWLGETVGDRDNAVGEMAGDFFGFDVGL